MTFLTRNITNDSEDNYISILFSCEQILYEMQIVQCQHLLLLEIPYFYAPPQKVAGYYVIPSDILGVCPSVHPSAVHHSCQLYNFVTVRDNFTKLGRNIMHDQTTCRD